MFTAVNCFNMFIQVQKCRPTYKENMKDNRKMGRLLLNQQELLFIEVINKTWDQKRTEYGQKEGEKNLEKKEKRSENREGLINKKDCKYLKVYSTRRVESQKYELLWKNEFH